ncbi:MAG: hypothetical protein IJB79_08315 [Candidatus Gastranaerophilales bacterium]|nr:hypothetical protein [Candidatus Gastranaerophilales bacterium]
MSYDSYLVAHDDYVNRYRARYGATPARQSASQPINSTQNNGTYSSGISDAGLFKNECTDGKDDGQINGFSKFLNVCEGVLGMGVNMVKSAIKHPFKTAAMIAVCCIPVVGPVIGAGMACYGIYNGVKTVATGIQAAQLAEANATSDAEAKAAWENVGSGIGQTALSVVALKGSAGVLKGQLNGGSQTVNLIKAAKGQSAGEIAKIAITEGIKETATNIGGIAQAGIKKASRVFEKGKQYWEAGKSGNLGQTLADDVATTANRAGEWAKGKIENFNSKQKIDDLPDGPFDADGNMTSVREDGTTIKWHKDGTGKITATADDGTVTVYGRNGKMISQKTTSSSNASTDGCTTTTKYGNGKTVVENVKYNADGTKTTTVTTTSAKGNTTVKSTTIDSSGKTINTTTTSNGITVEVDKSGKSTVTNTYNESNTGIIRTKGETIYMKDGVVIENPTPAQRAEIQAASSGKYIQLNQAIDNPFEFMGIEISDEMLMMLGILENTNE